MRANEIELVCSASGSWFRADQMGGQNTSYLEEIAVIVANVSMLKIKEKKIRQVSKVQFTEQIERHVPVLHTIPARRPRQLGPPY